MPERGFQPEYFLGGSHVAFKTRERPQLTEPERDVETENRRSLADGIIVLRKMRTASIEEPREENKQMMLREAHSFCDLMAEVILDDSLRDKPAKIPDSYVASRKEMAEKYKDSDWDSGYALPSQFSIQNLSRATDDMLVRIQEKAGSFSAPDHKLNGEEMTYVLKEFLTGVNDLTINAKKKFFDQNVKIGGILSGGSIYASLVKKVVERYGDASLTVDTFVIAVDKKNNRTAFEEADGDDETKTVIITDDVIHKGGTILTALWAAGEYFPKARIYSGKGDDEPGGWEKRRAEVHENHLTELFQDFAELAEEKRSSEALAVFEQAKQYAYDNRVELPGGWEIVKKRIEGKKKK